MNELEFLLVIFLTLLSIGFVLLCCSSINLYCTFDCMCYVPLLYIPPKDIVFAHML